MYQAFMLHRHILPDPGLPGTQYHTLLKLPSLNLCIWDFILSMIFDAVKVNSLNNICFFIVWYIHLSIQISWYRFQNISWHKSWIDMYLPYLTS